MVVLDGFDGEVLGLEGADGEDGGGCGGEVGAVADLVGDGAAADGDFVGAGFVAAGGVDDEADVAVFHHVHDVRSLLFGELVDALDGDVVFFEEAVGAAGGVDGEAEFDEVFGDRESSGLVAIVDGEEDVAADGKGIEGAGLGLGVGHAEVVADAHHFAGRFHFGSKDSVDAGEARPREDRFFDRVVRRDDFFGEAHVGELFAHHDLGGEFSEGDADGFGDEGDSAAGAGVDFDDVEFFVLDGELDVHEATHFKFDGEFFGGLANGGTHGFADGKGGDGAGGVAGVNAGGLDVLHDGADDGGVAVADAVDVDFGGAFEEAVDEDGALGGGVDGFVHVAAEFVVGVDDHHGAASEDEGRPNNHGIPNAVGDGDGFVFADGGAGFGLFEAEFVEKGGEEFAVFGEFDGLGGGSHDGDAGVFEAGGEVEGSLAAELNDDAVGLFLLANIEDVLEGERLEVELVAGVVVGGDGLGVGVDHDGLVSELFEGEGGVHAAVVELNSLADAVRSTA